ncbi:hypothetical protein PVK06_009238 [Gossypium arboreum]|uniref:Uncharacterized protein n=1 Tax=Gossypium arboreum TaxID=29729 RepID=A0ABR0QM96_GOSAR|nr:hypothetical protein PVK06_009238 [Gossypium arboreum]
MEANDLWEAVEEDYKDPSLPANPTMAQFKNQKERKSNERNHDMKLAFEVWNFLKEEYEGDERIKCMKILNLVGEFEVQKMDFGTMKEYFDKLLGIANKVSLVELMNAFQIQEQRRYMRSYEFVKGALVAEAQYNRGGKGKKHEKNKKGNLGFNSSITNT